jgi:hypothetical protein
MGMAWIASLNNPQQITTGWKRFIAILFNTVVIQKFKEIQSAK